MNTVKIDTTTTHLIVTLPNNKVITTRIADTHKKDGWHTSGDQHAAFMAAKRRYCIPDSFVWNGTK